MKIVPILALALGVALTQPLAGCGSVPAAPSDITAAAKRTITLTAGSAYLACSAVNTAHTAGKLTGAAFNKAKADCIAVDDLVDGAAAALALGDQAGAAAKISAAQAGIVTVQTETPKS